MSLYKRECKSKQPNITINPQALIDIFPHNISITKLQYRPALMYGIIEGRKLGKLQALYIALANQTIHHT